VGAIDHLRDLNGADHNVPRGAFRDDRVIHFTLGALQESGIGHLEQQLPVRLDLLDGRGHVRRAHADGETDHQE